MTQNSSQQHGGGREGAGRPKGSPDRIRLRIREEAAEHSSAAIETLRAILEGGADEGLKLAAATAILGAAVGHAASQRNNIDGAITR